VLVVCVYNENMNKIKKLVFFCFFNTFYIRLHLRIPFLTHIFLVLLLDLMLLLKSARSLFDKELPGRR